MLQHGAYNLLKDSCYDREQFPTMDEAIEWTWASTPEEIQAVEFVLSKFFKLQDDGTYHQKRINEELKAYHSRCATNKENRNKSLPNGDDSLNNNDESSPNDQKQNATNNHKPITNNHKPKNKRFKKPSVEEVAAWCIEKQYEVDPDQFWNFYESKDWMVGKNKMKSWKACLVTWVKRQKNNVSRGTSGGGSMVSRAGEWANK